MGHRPTTWWRANTTSRRDDRGRLAGVLPASKWISRCTATVICTGWPTSTCRCAWSPAASAGCRKARSARSASPRTFAKRVVDAIDEKPRLGKRGHFEQPDRRRTAGQRRTRLGGRRQPAVRAGRRQAPSAPPPCRPCVPAWCAATSPITMCADLDGLLALAAAAPLTAQHPWPPLVEG